LKHGDIVVTDNLSSQKVAGIRRANEAAGAKLRYLPTYSSDLNPIEMAFSKLKSFNERSINSGNSAVESASNSPNPSAEITSSTAADGFAALLTVSRHSRG
jgi:transposase